MVSFRDNTEVSVILMAVTVGPRTRKKVEERLAARKCLHCEQAIHRRGLCVTHYTRWRTAMQELPKRERPAFEAKLIESGKIAEDRQGHRGVENLFRDLAAERE